MGLPSVKKLAKEGDAEGLAKLWKEGLRFDLGEVFRLAVADYRTIRRKPSHLQLLLFYCMDQGLAVDRRLVLLASKYGNAEVVREMQGRGLPEDPFVAAAIGDLEGLRAHGEHCPLSELVDEGGFNLLHACAGSGLGRADAATASKLAETCGYLIAQSVSTTHSVTEGVAIGPALSCAWSGGNAQIMERLLDRGEIEVTDMHLEVEFTLEPHQRSGAPFYDVAGVILDRGFDVNSIRPDQGRTLLHGSSNRGAKVAVRWLLENGADPNALDEAGSTPLHVAAERNTHASVVSLLVDAGSDTSARNGDGRTPLEVAIERGRRAVADFLSE